MLNAELKIAIVVSAFNQAVTEGLLEGCLLQLLSAGLKKERVRVLKVPGAVEIPLTAKLLADTRQYDAIIALGAVIRGETTHYDYVCEQVSQGCQQVMMEYKIPLIFGVLTTEDEEQALARSSGNDNKGKRAADAALTMVKLVKAIETTEDH